MEDTDKTDTPQGELQQPPPAAAPSETSAASVSLTFDTSLPKPADWEHLVVSLSSRKQDQIMEGIGRSHSEESCFSTWSVVAEALSNALLAEPDDLYLQSTTKIHRKDFLLFTRKTNARGDGTNGILEVDFTQKLDAATWQCHWQEARPQFVHVVRTSLEQFFKLEASRKGVDAQSEPVGKNED